MAQSGVAGAGSRQRSIRAKETKARGIPVGALWLTGKLEPLSVNSRLRHFPGLPEKRLWNGASCLGVGLARAE